LHNILTFTKHLQKYHQKGIHVFIYFIRTGKYFWSTVQNRRKFLDKFADIKQFDPLSPAAWQKITKSDLYSIPGGKYLLYFYKQSLERALAELYPELGLPKQVRCSNPLYICNLTLS